MISQINLGMYESLIKSSMQGKYSLKKITTMLKGQFAKMKGAICNIPVDVFG